MRRVVIEDSDGVEVAMLWVGTLDESVSNIAIFTQTSTFRSSGLFCATRDRRAFSYIYFWSDWSPADTSRARPANKSSQYPPSIGDEADCTAESLPLWQRQPTSSRVCATCLDALDPPGCRVCTFCRGTGGSVAQPDHVRTMKTGRCARGRAEGRKGGLGAK